MKYISTLFKAWSALAHHNTDIYQCIRPFILKSLTEPSLKDDITTLLFNIISSNIKDPTLIQKILGLID